MMALAWIVVALFALVVALFAYADYDATVRPRAPYVPTHRRPEPRDVADVQLATANHHTAAEATPDERDWDAMDHALYELLMRDDIDWAAAAFALYDALMRDEQPPQPGEYNRDDPDTCTAGECGHGFATGNGPNRRVLAIAGRAT